MDNCFFCNKSDGKLYSCTAKLRKKHVNEWAVYMQDSKLLAKLSEGDMTTTGAKYQKNCLTNMYNKFKAKQKNAAVEKELLSTIKGILHNFQIYVHIKCCELQIKPFS